METSDGCISSWTKSQNCGCSKYVVVASVRPGRGSDFGRIFAATSLAQINSTLIRKYVFSIDSRQEPYEVILHVRICAGDGQQWQFLPRFYFAQKRPDPFSFCARCQLTSGVVHHRLEPKPTVSKALSIQRFALRLLDFPDLPFRIGSSDLRMCSHRC